MSPPTTEARRQKQESARKIRVMQGVPLKNKETGQYSLLTRSAGLVRQSKTLLLELSEPAQHEECIIAMEAIKDYRLPFMPIGFREGIVEVEPELTKACLPCGHGFNALALLYHFAKNSMTCPFCRAGHEKHQLSLHQRGAMGRIRHNLLRCWTRQCPTALRWGCCAAQAVRLRKTL